MNIWKICLSFVQDNKSLPRPENNMNSSLDSSYQVIKKKKRRSRFQKYILLTKTLTTKQHRTNIVQLILFPAAMKKKETVYTWTWKHIIPEPASPHNSLLWNQFLFQEINEKTLPGNNPISPCEFVPCHQSSDAGSISVIISPSWKLISLSSAAS